MIPLVKKNIPLNDLLPKNFPSTPFILKTNHNSGGTYIVLNKDESNWEGIYLFCEKQLKLNHYSKTKEWQYKNIIPIRY